MKRYSVTIRLLTPMLGTVPMNKDVYDQYILGLKREEMKKSAKNGAALTFEPTEDELNAEVETVGEREEKGWTTFHVEEGTGLIVYDYFIKGFIRYAGNVLKEELKVVNLKAKLTNYLFVFPRRVPLGKQKPDGVLERPLRAWTPKGERVSLARSDYVDEGTEITFQIGMFEQKEITEKLVRKIFEYGQFQGLGQFRNGGYGRFEVVKFEEEK